MADKVAVVILVGSLRKGSITRRAAIGLTKAAPSSMSFEFLDVGNLPLYNQDLETDTPQTWQTFRERIKRADAVLFATPEYNRSVPGLLKNAIDVGSRPHGQNAFAGKPALVVSVTPGALGAFGANHHLRQSLVFLDMPALQQPEAYISHAADLFDEQGNITNDDTRKFLEKIMTTFADWIAKTGKR